MQGGFHAALSISLSLSLTLSLVLSLRSQHWPQNLPPSSHGHCSWGIPGVRFEQMDGTNIDLGPKQNNIDFNQSYAYKCGSIQLQPRNHLFGSWPMFCDNSRRLRKEPFRTNDHTPEEHRSRGSLHLRPSLGFFLEPTHRLHRPLEQPRIMGGPKLDWGVSDDHKKRPAGHVDGTGNDARTETMTPNI